ncbi:ribbon-helix-helix protein, CopG family [Candidatus Woesearchaeota archaeon]|nr:ribbon-helix-helix protein, CopG family [Candidatus Woesearchaeota archaeon]
MGAVTVRLNDKISGFVELLSRDTNKSRSEVVRELLTKAASEEKTNYWLKKYKNREVTLRKVAKELGVPLWKVLEIVGENQPYELSDLQRDLRAIGE